MAHLVQLVFLGLLDLFNYVFGALGIDVENLTPYLPTLVPLTIVLAFVLTCLLLYFVIRTLYRFFN